MDYCTTAEAFAYGASAGSGTDPVSEQAVMASAITAVSRAIDGHTHLVWSQATYAQQRLRGRVDADGALIVALPAPSASALTALDYRAGAALAWTPATVADADLTSADNGSWLRLLGVDLSGWRYRRLEVRVSYTGGYATIAALPADLRWAAQATAWYEYQRRTAPLGERGPEGLALSPVPSAWPAHIVDRLARYVRVVGS